jgi:excisionase family DNA binding protein
VSDTLKRYLSVKKICERLAVGKSLVYRLVQTGELPATRLGSKILIPEDGLLALLERGQARQAVALPASLPSRPKPREPQGRLDLW